jgi:hypothetical protein
MGVVPRYVYILTDVLHGHRDGHGELSLTPSFSPSTEFVAPTLTGISIFCLARRDSAWFTRIFGGSNGNEGLGMFSLCLDWNYTGSGGGSLGALFTPFSTQVSQYAGVALCCILFCSM